MTPSAKRLARPEPKPIRNLVDYPGLGTLLGVLLTCGAVLGAAYTQHVATRENGAASNVLQQQVALADAARVGIEVGIVWLGFFALFLFVVLTDARRNQP